MTEPQAPEIPVREGDVLAGKYRVERVLGVGGMGVVVAAMHAELDQKVALKILLPQVAQNPAVIARFAREARAAAKIKSEHVVRVSDVGTLESGLPYIVMEYLDGEDLSQVLESKGRLPPGTTVDYILQACEALAEAHAAGFVHRDLKPGNLFLARGPDGSEILKVLDFGISKAAIGDAEPHSARPGSLTRTTDIFGSPLYMSPEQLKSVRDVDARADIWALGVILVELISGKSPFERTTIAETFGAILYEKPESLKKIEGVSAELDAAVMRCLATDPAARYQNVAELSKALFPFAAHASRQSLDRTSRVLKLAGMSVDTVPPSTAGAASIVPPPGASTKTSWGAADRAPGPRSARTAVVVGAGLSVVVAAAMFFVITRVAPPKPNPATPASELGHDGAASGPKPRPAEPATPTATPMVTVSVSGAPTVDSAPIAPIAPSTVSAVVSAAPSVVPGPTAPAPGKPSPAKTAAAPPPATVAPAPPPPARKPPEDTNGFGDRK